ncbi:MAG: hypothetical protein CO162_02660 [bacterium (Candidatus Ratteibacteria) CG_4_9_14_3_um_filter_41_21]|uniref:Terminase n=1 Tax=bacterium (Candidatus Ratteibacteria) CG_4_9_14_3_um_filter_41_21 TaxID=2014289 RepID=A0A2M7YGP7_9BACT|nr:MAG: hypothetical protein CO162_02660 [bacterium (Candidatus Ratteibacteria) CG_4_9_14_3_um_filter_41_21]
MAIKEERYDYEKNDEDLYNIEVGRRPILQFWKALKTGQIKTDKSDSRYAPFQYQYDFLTSRKTNCWIIGANKSGKSEACHIKTALTLMGLNKLIPAPNDGYVVGLDWATIRDTILSRILELIPSADLLGRSVEKAWSASKRTLFMTNGSKAIFKSADSGRLKFQGALLDWVQIDEEIPYSVYKEVKMRGKGGKQGEEKRLYIWGTALPNLLIGRNSYLYKEIVMKKNTPNYDVFTSIMDDNLSLSEEQKDEWKDSCSGNEYTARVLGEFFSSTELGIFNGEYLQEIKENYKQSPLSKGRLKKIDGMIIFEAHGTGKWQIWKMPQQGQVYSIGVDSSTGESEDPSCIQILDVITQEQVAKFWGKVDEDTLAEEIVKSGQWYNNSSVIIEVTGGIGRAVQNQVMKLGYYNLYRREIYDQYGQVLSDRLGWETKGGRGDGGTKPLLLMDGKRYVNGGGIIRDVETIEEFQNYLRFADGSSGARHGCHDDMVIAYLLALRQINEGKCFDIILPSCSFPLSNEIKSREDAEAWLYD